MTAGARDPKPRPAPEPAPPRDSFAGILPPLALRSFRAWQAARRTRPEGADLPRLFDFAPMKLPPDVLPWAMLQRRRGPSDYVYGLFGDEMMRLYGTGRKGTPVLSGAEPAERARRLGVMEHIAISGRPAWLTGAMLVEGKGGIPVGRLALPVQAGPDRALFTLFFLFAELPPDLPKLRIDGLAAPDVLMCPEAELDGEG